MKTTIWIDKEDMIKFDDFFEKVRNVGRRLGELRSTDGWGMKFKFLVNRLIDQERKFMKELEEVKNDRTKRIGEASSLRIIVEKLEGENEELRSEIRKFDETILRLRKDKEKYRKKYLGLEDDE